jgi:hypothetical protein
MLCTTAVYDDVTDDNLDTSDEKSLTIAIAITKAVEKLKISAFSMEFLKYNAQKVGHFT